MNEKRLSERDICSQFITPALLQAGWDPGTQIREEYPLTQGRIIVRGRLHTRARHKRADYVLFYKPHIPIAVIEAKDNNHTAGDGMQQGPGYADMLQVPFVFYLSLYQAVTGTEEEKNIYRQFSRDFFDLIVIDECHRGSAAADSAWREILEYFSSATQIGMTATPKETKDVSNIDYFGDPIYTYSLRQGIDDGFLAPYKVVRIDLDKDLAGWRPDKGMRNKFGHEIEDRIYNQQDFDKTLVLEKRTELVAKKITEFLRQTHRFDKTIVFCENIDHAERMRQALVNENSDLVAENGKYVMRITGDSEEGKAELDNFVFPESKYPVIATTSKMMSTGVDAQTCKLIVLDQRILSMTEFKQTIGRGTRINEDYGKYYFTIMDFKKATELFADPAFNGEPVQVYEPQARESPVPPDLPVDELDDEIALFPEKGIRLVGRYGEKARAVLDALLDKYADAGVTHIEETRILTISPFTRIGTPMEIIRSFGGQEQYQQAIQELEQALYSA